MQNFSDVKFLQNAHTKYHISFNSSCPWIVAVPVIWLKSQNTGFHLLKEIFWGGGTSEIVAILLPLFYSALELYPHVSTP